MSARRGAGPGPAGHSRGGRPDPAPRPLLQPAPRGGLAGEPAGQPRLGEDLQHERESGRTRAAGGGSAPGVQATPLRPAVRVAPWGSPFWRLGERWREGFVLHLRNQTSILAAPVRAPRTEVPLAVCPAAGRQVATPPRLVSLRSSKAAAVRGRSRSSGRTGSTRASTSRSGAGRRCAS